MTCLKWTANFWENMKVNFCSLFTGQWITVIKIILFWICLTRVFYQSSLFPWSHDLYRSHGKIPNHFSPVIWNGRSSKFKAFIHHQRCSLMPLSLPLQSRCLPHLTPALKEIKEKKMQNLAAGDSHIKYIALLCSFIWILPSEAKQSLKFCGTSRRTFLKRDKRNLPLSSAAAGAKLLWIIVKPYPDGTAIFIQKYFCGVKMHFSLGIFQDN